MKESKAEFGLRKCATTLPFERRRRWVDGGKGVAIIIEKSICGSHYSTPNLDNSAERVHRETGMPPRACLTAWKRR